MVDDYRDLPPASRIAVVWQPAPGHAALGALLALDERLALTVAQAREPLLAQLKLAWWRDRLSEDTARRPKGEPLLVEIGLAWADREALLVALVDAWEAMLDEAAWTDDSWRMLIAARADSFSGVAAISGAAAEPARAAGIRWSCADLFVRAPEASIAQTIREAGQAASGRAPSTRRMRGIAVLDALARHALARGEPLMAGRSAALIALRVGMFGR